MVDSEPGGTQTVQIRGIKMTAERITVSRRIKNVQKNKEIKMTNMSKLTCKRSIKLFFIIYHRELFRVPSI